MDANMHEDELLELKSKWESPGPCPPAEKLAAFAEKSLPAEELLLIRHHVERCGICDWELTALKEFDAGLAHAPEHRLAWIPRLLAKPSLAYFLVLALLYPAYLGIFREPQVIYRTTPHRRPAAPTLESAGVVELGEATAKRGPASSAAHEIRIASNQKTLVFHFYLPVNPDHAYRMRILRAGSDQPVSSAEIHSQDPVGNFSIVAPADLFAGGEYAMAIQEQDKATGQELDRYEFHILINR